MTENKLKAALNALRKECVKVVPSKTGFNNSMAAEVRFAGPAYAENGDKHLICPQCNNKLSFVFQFREKYDKNFKPSGSLFSVFYCFDCMPIGRHNEEIGQWAVVEHKNPNPDKFVDGFGVNSKLIPCSCTLNRVFVLPDYETIETNYPEIAELCEELDSDDPISVYEDYGLEIGCDMEPSTTLGGFPIWIQGEGSQVCPEAGCTPQFIAQIDSEEMADLMWGDAGCLYLFRCKDHKHFTIEMQCF